MDRDHRDAHNLCYVREFDLFGQAGRANCIAPTNGRDLRSASGNCIIRIEHELSKHPTHDRLIRRKVPTRRFVLSLSLSLSLYSFFRKRRKKIENVNDEG